MNIVNNSLPVVKAVEKYNKENPDKLPLTMTNSIEGSKSLGGTDQNGPNLNKTIDNIC